MTTPSILMPQTSQSCCKCGAGMSWQAWRATESDHSELPLVHTTHEGSDGWLAKCVREQYGPGVSAEVFCPKCR